MASPTYVRYLLLALLTCPLFCACTTTARRAIRHEHATSRHHQSLTPVNPTN